MTGEGEAADVARSAPEPEDERWLTSGVGGIGAASLLADLGHEVPTALLPSLLTTTSGAPAAALGLIEGVADGLAGGARLGGGALADDPQRRRRRAVGGYTATAVLSAQIGLASSVWQVGVLRAGAWTARGLRVPARNALLADVVPPRPTVAPTGSSGRWTTSARSAARCWRSPCRRSKRPHGDPGLGHSRLARSRRDPLRDPRYTAAESARPTADPAARPPRAARRAESASSSASRCSSVGNIAATLLILRATELLEPSHSQHRAATLALLLYVTLQRGCDALVSIPAGRLGDRRGFPLVLTARRRRVRDRLRRLRGRRRAVRAWHLVRQPLAQGSACVETAEHAAVASRAPPTVRGSAFGLLAGVQSLGNFVASGLAGILWTVFSAEVAFVYAAACMVFALTIFVRPSRALVTTGLNDAS